MNNENMVGSVTIPVEEYKEMILREKQLEDIISELNNDLKLFKKFENIVMDDLYKNERYSIRNLELEDGVIKKEYHYRELVREFLNLDITDLRYIDGKIYEFHKRCIEEDKEKNNE